MSAGGQTSRERIAEILEIAAELWIFKFGDEGSGVSGPFLVEVERAYFKALEDAS